MVTLGWPRVPEGQRFDRALGCMLGMVIGDSLGSQVEFQNAETIRATYPGGVRDLAASPVWHTLAGQPTDDFELGLALARSLVRTRPVRPRRRRVRVWALVRQRAVRLRAHHRHGVRRRSVGDE